MENQYYYRYAHESDVLKLSIETNFDSMIEWFTHENIMKYWQAKWYPDFPDCVESLDDFECYVENKVKIAQQTHEISAMIEVLEMIASIEAYHVKITVDFGPILEADGVNVSLSQGNCCGTPAGIDEWELEGELGSENLLRDGFILKNARIVRKL